MSSIIKTTQDKQTKAKQDSILHSLQPSRTNGSRLTRIHAFNVSSCLSRTRSMMRRISRTPDNAQSTEYPVHPTLLRHRAPTAGSILRKKKNNSINIHVHPQVSEDLIHLRIMMPCVHLSIIGCASSTGGGGDR